MARVLTDSMRASGTPEGVIIRAEASPPNDDPTLGIAVQPSPGRAELAPPKHRLVAIGDSLTHGFQSGAIYHTDLSYPAIIAWEMGWSRHFRYPRYPGFGGLPINIEYIVRHLEDAFGDRLDWWNVGLALFRVRSMMDDIEDYWERGAGSKPEPGVNHNLGAYGFDVRDVLSRTVSYCERKIGTPRDNWLFQIVEAHQDRAALRVLPPRADGYDPATIDAAEALGKDGGIETLLVFVGANNALGSVLGLKVTWSTDEAFQDLDRKNTFTVWQPCHFRVEFNELVERVRRIDARHVIFSTVPHVTIAPVARGVHAKVHQESRYFPYYTRPWIRDADFNPKDDPKLTENEARAIDSAIDQYNATIVDAVRAARGRGDDWYLLDIAAVLDRLAYRRYQETPAAQPEWWTPYELPPDLTALRPVPDSRFFAVGPGGRQAGGLFSLDGVHPTTIGYGIIAQEFIRVMERAGVSFYFDDGVTRRQGPVRVDFRRLIALDTLVSDPPGSFTNDLQFLGWLDEKVDVLRRILGKVL